MTVSRLFDNVEVDGRRVRVRVEHGRVTHVVAPMRQVPATDDVVHGEGRALLPGLHEHHLHVLALAARHAAVPCGPYDVTDRQGLLEALRATPGDGWVHGAGYDESVAGRLDRHDLDLLVPDRPVCLQHRGEELTLLNSRAVALVDEVLDRSADVERDGSGTPTGRVHRYDERLRLVVPDPALDLTRVGRLLGSHGITGVTDATADLDEHSLSVLREAAEARALPHLTLLGAPNAADLPMRTGAGPWRLPLQEDDLPDARRLLDLIANTHATGRAFSITIASPDSLALVVSVLDRASRMPGDRVELAPDVHVDEAARLRGISVVLHLGGPAGADLPLPAFASLIAAGVQVAVASDAPYGELDPWRVIAAAGRLGETAGGPSSEALVDRALAAYLSTPAAPGDDPRRVRQGARADLMLLDAPLDDVLDRLASGTADDPVDPVDPVVAVFEGADDEPVAEARARMYA